MYRSSSLTTFLESNSVLFFLTSATHDVAQCSNGFNKLKNGVSNSCSFVATVDEFSSHTDLSATFLRTSVEEDHTLDEWVSV